MPSGAESGDGVSETFLNRIRDAGATEDLVQRLKLGGKPPRQRLADFLSSALPYETAVGVALGVSAIAGEEGALPLAVAAAASLVATLIRARIDRNREEHVSVPPATTGSPKGREADIQDA
jgi:hypothetical protein